jgi:hypothetical protein
MFDTSNIVILEDDLDRIHEMRVCLSDKFPEIEIIVFDNAPDMINWLKEHLEKAIIICLDHDLGPNRFRHGDPFDPGTGRDVADYLATRQPSCHILIHTTNSMAAPGMEMVLADSGWSHSRVLPYCDLEWIKDSWIVDVLKMIRQQ